MELFVNDPGTTLNGNITSGASSIVVSNSSGYPTTGNFRIKIGSELMLVTAVSGTTWTVTRGIEGTTPASALSGAAVSHVLTAGGLTAITSNSTLIGTYSSLPTSGLLGARYRCTDIPIELVYDGSAWKAFYSGWPVTLPSATTFTTTLNGASIVTNGVKILSAPDLNNLYGQDIALPATPYTIIAGFSSAGYDTYYPGGIYIRNSTGTNMQWFARFHNASGLQGAHFSNYTGLAGGTQDASTTWQQSASCFYIKLVDNGSTFSFSAGTTPYTFGSTIYAPSRTSFMSSPGFVGWFGTGNNSGPPIGAQIMLFDWTQS
jgi:hypothetical protein